MTLTQKAIENKNKTNEIPIFRSLLDDLTIKGKTITAYALHCLKETCKKIKAKKGDYVFGVRDNQRNLHKEIERFFNNPMDDSSLSTFETIEKNEGRMEKRICRASANVDWITDISEWTGLTRIFSVTRITTAQGKTTEETGYYISSPDADAKQLLYMSRSHWKIESMHWALDVIWGEDHNNLRSDNAQKVMNVFRKLALFAHKQYVSSLSKKPSVKQNVWQALLDDSVCCSVLNQIHKY